MLNSWDHRLYEQSRIRLVIHFLLLATLLAPVCKGQNSGNLPCGHSTVSDAWGPKFASRAESFLTELQHIVRTDNKTEFAALVRYPIDVSRGSKTSRVFTPADFVRRYRSIVTPDLQQTILIQKPECLFANGQGVMVGHGQLWFREQEGGALRIITITLDSPKPSK